MISEKLIAEQNEFLRELSENLGHREDEKQVKRVLRATLHILRERLTIQQSLHLMAQLPAFLKLMYVEGWKYHEKPMRFRTVEDFKEAVKEEQFQLGERDFDWNESTEKIISVVIESLKKYLSPGEISDILAELPSELHPLFVP
jgi:uncharacterized protein (DUF2267 family)